jgi:ribonuclease HI
MIDIAVDGSAHREIGGSGITIANGLNLENYHVNVPTTSVTADSLRDYATITRDGFEQIIPNQTNAVKVKPTNNRAELLAIFYAVHFAMRISARNIRIISDSQYSIYAFTGFIRGLSAAEVLLKINGDIILAVRNIMTEYTSDGNRIVFRKIKAHVTKKKMSEMDEKNKRYTEMNILADMYSSYELN